MAEPRFRPRPKPVKEPDNPVLMRAIVVAAAVVVLAGVIWAAVIGHLFT